MRGINKVILMGKLSAPEQVGSGTVKFSVVVENHGAGTVMPCSVTCEATTKIADVILLLEDGRQVYVEGRLTQREAGLVVTVDTLQVIGRVG